MTQNYGGGLWYTWFDRDLGVAGRVVVKRAAKSTRKARHALVKIDLAMRIPSLAIHLNREMNNGFAVNFQQHMVLIIANAAEAALEADPSTPPNPRGPRRPTKEPPRKNAGRHHPALLELGHEDGQGPGRRVRLRPAALRRAAEHDRGR